MQNHPDKRPKEEAPSLETRPRITHPAQATNRRGMQ